jgi:hypothetical protein
MYHVCGRCFSDRIGLYIVERKKDQKTLLELTLGHVRLNLSARLISRGTVFFSHNKTISAGLSAKKPSDLSMACELPIRNMRMRYFTPTHRCFVRKVSTQAVVYIHIRSFISIKYKHMCIHSILVTTYEGLDRQHRCVTVDNGHITYGRIVQLNARKNLKNTHTNVHTRQELKLERTGPSTKSCSVHKP